MVSKHVLPCRRPEHEWPHPLLVRVIGLPGDGLLLLSCRLEVEEVVRVLAQDEDLEAERDEDRRAWSDSASFVGRAAQDERQQNVHSHAIAPEISLDFQS